MNWLTNLAINQLFPLHDPITPIDRNWLGKRLIGRLVFFPVQSKSSPLVSLDRYEFVNDFVMGFWRDEK